MSNLEERLWDSDESSPLTHEAAREIERLNWRLDRLNRAMPEALALIMFDDLKRQYDESRACGIGWLDGAAGVADVEMEGHVDLVSLAQAVLSTLKGES